MNRSRSLGGLIFIVALTASFTAIAAPSALEATGGREMGGEALDRIVDMARKHIPAHARKVIVGTHR